MSNVPEAANALCHTIDAKDNISLAKNRIASAIKSIRNSKRMSDDVKGQILPELLHKEAELENQYEMIVGIVETLRNDTEKHGITVEENLIGRTIHF